METEKTQETTCKLNVKLNHHLLCHLIQSCSKLPEHESIFQGNPHLYLYKEGKLNSVGNTPSNDHCLGPNASLTHGC